MNRDITHAYVRLEKCKTQKIVLVKDIIQKNQFGKRQPFRPKTDKDFLKKKAIYRLYSFDGAAEKYVSIEICHLAGEIKIHFLQ